jgi:hypothetical protein
LELELAPDPEADEEHGDDDLPIDMSSRKE